MADAARPGSGSGVELWSSPSWRALAVDWLDERLAAAGIERTGEVGQPHLRPWATALWAPTTRGAVWLKAAAPGSAFEVGLYELLERVAPGSVLTPIARDADRGWIVLPDGGTPLGGRLSGAELADAMATVLPQYGQLQRDLASHAGALLELGVTDMRPAVMPERFGQALAIAGEYVERHGDLAAAAVERRLAGLGEQVEEWCSRLAAMPGAASIDHNDLHPWNVFLGAGQERARFYDWGDSVVAHPFASMLVALGFVQSRVLDVSPADPRVLRLRDAYMEVFSDLASHAELVEALELACRVGKIARTLTWSRAVRALRGAGAGEGWESAPFQTLASLLDDSYLGGA